jgi:hypothetical protein
LGGEYRSTREPGIGVPSGIKRVLFVPVWNQTQGLGQRMPNLMYSQSQTPFIFLDGLIPIEFNFTFRLFFATALALIIGNFTILSWGISAVKTRLLFFDLALLGPFVLFTVKNDWYCQAEQYWGLSLLILSLLHRQFFDISKSSKATQSFLPLIGLLIGFNLVITNHPSLYSIAFFSVLILLSSKKVLGVIWRSRLMVAGLALSVYFLVVELVELTNYRVETASNPYLTQSSTWDFFDSSNWVYRFQPVLAPIASAAHPILYFGNEAGSRTEFFNLSFLILLLVSLRRGIDGAALRSLIQRSIGSSLLLIVLLIFSGPLASQNLLGFERVFAVHGWFYAHSILIIVIGASSILFGEQRFLDSFFVRRSLMVTWLSTFGVLIALLYPAVLYFKDSDNSNFSIFRDSRVESINERELVKNVTGMLFSVLVLVCNYRALVIRQLNFSGLRDSLKR